MRRRIGSRPACLRDVIGMPACAGGWYVQRRRRIVDRRMVMVLVTGTLEA
jgi:hypothetical protein